MSYGRFLAMIATSTVVMFGLMYLNTYLLSHVFWSETRAYMALVMGATMAIIMLGFMLSMYASARINAAIFAGALLLFGGSLWLVRSQATVGDTSYMSAMIPHHSIAIMTSSRADISDSRVRKLADEIIYAQDKEIAEMRYLLSDIEANGDESDGGESATAKLVELDEALSTAEVPVLDPEFMTEAEIGELFPAGPECTFTYTADSPPVLAAAGGEGGAEGVVKISGDLVRLSSDNAAALVAGPTLTAEGVSMRVSAADGGALSAATQPQEADLFLELAAGLSVGYRGYYGCGAAD